MIGRVRELVEDCYGWRRFDFGPETAGYTSTLMVDTYVEWRQFGASIRFDQDEDSRNVCATFGPLGMVVCLGRKVALAEDPDEPAPRWVTWRVGGRDLSLYQIRRHLGATVSWARLRTGLAARAEMGAVGVVLEPGNSGGQVGVSG